MKNIKDKIFTIMAAAAMLISAGTCAGTGVQPNPAIPTVPGVEQGELPPKNPDDDNTPGDQLDPNCNLNDDFELDE